MSADDARYVQAAAAALRAAPGDERPGDGTPGEIARAVLAAVLPLVRADVRREVLAEVAAPKWEPMCQCGGPKNHCVGPR